MTGQRDRWAELAGGQAGEEYARRFARHFAEVKNLCLLLISAARRLGATVGAWRQGPGTPRNGAPLVSWFRAGRRPGGVGLRGVGGGVVDGDELLEDIRPLHAALRESADPRAEEARAWLDEAQAARANGCGRTAMHYLHHALVHTRYADIAEAVQGAEASPWLDVIRQRVDEADEAGGPFHGLEHLSAQSARRSRRSPGTLGGCRRRPTRPVPRLAVR